MNIEIYKQNLEEEIVSLNEGLKIIGHQTADFKNDWVHNPPTERETEPDLQADQEDEIETNEGIINTLEERLQEVNAALRRIADGTYGVCRVCSKEIETQRLDADPAATTCIEHIDN